MVVNRDGAAIAEIDDEDGKPDRGFRCRDRQNEKRKNLPCEISEIDRKRHKIDVHREQDQLDGHQDDDDILAVDENAEHADREEQRGQDQIMRTGRQSRHTPCPGLTSSSSMASAGTRLTCRRMDCRRTPVRWRSVRTMAPIIATSRISPAV